MDDDELDRLDALAQAATPGPWLTPEEAGDSDDPRIPLDHEGMYVWPWHHEADMRLAYASRTAIPALVAEVRRLRALAEAAGIDTLPDNVTAASSPRTRH